MQFEEILTQVIALLQSQGRVSYRALKLRFQLDEEYLAGITEELIDAQRIARDEDGKVLVWTGAAAVASEQLSVASSSPPPAAERRQLTVLFCDLVGSTALSTRLDPEDLRELVRAYQQTCATVIQQHEGHIAQYLGDGLLVYFGYPTAHEDDARRAVRAGLEIITAMHEQVPAPLVEQASSLPAARMTALPKREATGAHGRLPLQVRIGMHTGVVVIGEMGAAGHTEQLALGDTPNIAARLQGLAEPNTVLISAPTYRLLGGQFECQPFGSHLVKGLDTPLAVYHVQSERQGVSALTGTTTLTPLVGREQEVGLLVDRWEQVKEGQGQVVLLSGEPGIGKSRLAYTLREHVTTEGSLLFEARCSPYHQHSALYPLIDSLQRLLLLTRQDTDAEKVEKLERALTLYGMQDTLPLFTALLSLPPPTQAPPLTLTPQKQKERTLQALLQLLTAQAERQATVSVWEDLHWADPSSLEFLTLLIEQLPTTKLLLVLTFRPEFTPPWKPRSHISQLVLNRLGKKQVEMMIEQAAAGKSLPVEVIEQIRLKTDGVPLFVEEVTKAVVEAEGGGARPAVPLQTIPATLQEALLARLDRLSEARQIAQLGATLGREFSHELLQAVAPLSETDLHTALSKLVEAEILYQRGVGEQARYFFKHALIQDTAYQSLLKSTRQQYHQKIARVLEERFPDTKETQPELLAHHYTEANLSEQAIPYWQQAGQRAVQRSANVEAINHLTKGLDLLKTLADNPEHARQELNLQSVLGTSLVATRGYATPEVEEAYTKALALCQRMGETPQILPVLRGLRFFYNQRAELQRAYELGEQMLRLAQRLQDTTLLVEAHAALGATLFARGELTASQAHVEQGTALYDLQQHRPLTLLYGQDAGVTCLEYASWTLWALGYPDQALKKSQEAIALAQELSHPFSLAFALGGAVLLRQIRRAWQENQDQTERMMTLCHEQGFRFVLAVGTIQRGWVLAEQGQAEEGIAQIHQGIVAMRATGSELGQPHRLGLLAEVYGKEGWAKEGLTLLAEALAAVDRTGERSHEADLYRLKGDLTLQQQFQVSGSKFQVAAPQPLTPDPQGEAEACFLKALDIARQQQAKSWELRASTSLARLWQQQGKRAEAHKLLSGIYNWFTEGFDTKDLQEAKALIEELSV